MPMPTRARRYVARQILHTNAVHAAVIQHEMWRLCHTENESFTEKELAYLKKTDALFKEVLERMTKLGDKLQRSL